MTKNRSPTLKLVTNAFYADAWAITPAMYDRLQEIVSERASGFKPDLAEIEARIDGRTYGVDPDTETQDGDVRVIALHGVLISRAGMFDQMSGATTPQAFASLVRQAADDPAVATIVLDLDSPGGTVSGTQLAAEAVGYAAEKKKVIACINDMACSAAYWIASAASEIVMPTNAMVGSIGVIGTHVDRSKAFAQAGLKHTIIRSTPGKALGQPSEAMSGPALEQAQSRVDALHAEFVQAVATGRDVSLETAASWATGNTWLGQAAVDAGLADRIGSISTVLAELSVQPAASGYPDGSDVIVVPAAAQTTDAPSEQPDPAATALPGVQNPPPDPSPLPAQSANPALEAPTMNIAAITAKLNAGQTLTPEERAFLNTHLDGQASVPSAPDMSSWPPEARTAFEQSQATARSAQEAASAAQATASTERNIRLEREFRERALAVGQPAEFGATLRVLHESNPEAAAEVETRLRAANAQVRLTAEIGGVGTRPGADGAQATIEARAKELEKTGMKPDAALTAAMQELGAASSEYRKEVSA
ncbi:S49 family peptidase [Deinococcus sp. UYEF24]